MLSLDYVAKDSPWIDRETRNLSTYQQEIKQFTQE